MQAYKALFLAGAVGSVLILSACNPATPSQVEAGKMRVKEQVVTETLDITHPDAAQMDTIAKNILRNGRGEVSLAIPYIKGDVGSAGRAGAMYMKEFGERGVNIGAGSISLVLVPEKKYAAKTVLTYPAIVALPAKGCRRIPGYQAPGDLEDVQEYQFGCEHQSVMSKMIADPSDLLGRAATGEDGDSMRNSIVIENHKTGKPNSALGGMSIGGGG